MICLLPKSHGVSSMCSFLWEVSSKLVLMIFVVAVCLCVLSTATRIVSPTHSEPYGQICSYELSLWAMWNTEIKVRVSPQIRNDIFFIRCEVLTEVATNCGFLWRFRRLWKATISSVTFVRSYKNCFVIVYCICLYVSTLKLHLHVISMHNYTIRFRKLQRDLVPLALGHYVLYVPWNIVSFSSLVLHTRPEDGLIGKGRNM